MTLTDFVRTRRDRLADWLVIGVVVVALLLGWAVRAWTVGHVKSFSHPDLDLTLNYPSGWLMSSNGDYVLKVRDPNSGPFKTTYQVMTDQLDPARPLSLVDAVNATSFSRARKLTAFRLLDIETVGEKDQSPSAIWSRYVYVEEKPDPFRETLPTVVLGLDYTVVKDGFLHTFTLLASEADFDQAERDFRAFIQNAGFDG